MHHVGPAPDTVGAILSPVGSQSMGACALHRSLGVDI